MKMAPGRSNADPRPAAKGAAARLRSSAPAETQSTETLRTEIEELRRNSQYRSLFLSRLAHELRTPLTSILGFSEIMLSQEKLTDAQRGFCERIQSSARQLQASLNQLSDLARLEGTQARRSSEPISIAEIIREVAPALTRSLEKRGAKLSINAPDDLPRLMSDRARIRLVTYNLLAYAISRSGEGATVFISVTGTPQAIAIEVRDSGDPLADPSRIGVLDADDNSNTNELGLSIAHQNVKILGGTMSAQNLDEGVELTVTLPLESDK